MARKRPNYHDDLRERLTDPAYAVAYLEAALEERDMPAVFLLALRNVAEARGMTRLARETKLNRENLYAMLSSRQPGPQQSLCDCGRAGDETLCQTQTGSLMRGESVAMRSE